MIFKKKFLLLTLFFILILQSLLFLNNKQKTTLKYFNLPIREVSIGKLINISFFSGLIISTLLNTKTTIYKKNPYENFKENYESVNNEEDMQPNFEMPPQRDIRDTQPTISVNYRVVKNTKENNLKSDQSYSNNSDKIDDWDNDINDW
mgnify:CR=1 FL=1|tara:strand:+ start:142 stop:585 length:444 start_codon:yes stop_codon:yes gene_type:complete